MGEPIEPYVPSARASFLMGQIVNVFNDWGELPWDVICKMIDDTLKEHEEAKR